MRFFSSKLIDVIFTRNNWISGPPEEAKTINGDNSTTIYSAYGNDATHMSTLSRRTTEESDALLSHQYRLQNLSRGKTLWCTTLGSFRFCRFYLQPFVIILSKLYLFNTLFTMTNTQIQLTFTVQAACLPPQNHRYTVKWELNYYRLPD